MFVILNAKLNDFISLQNRRSFHAFACLGAASSHAILTIVCFFFLCQQAAAHSVIVDKLNDIGVKFAIILNHTNVQLSQINQII